MGCGYSTISGRRGRLRVRDRTQVDSDSVEGEYTCGFSPGKNRRGNRKASNNSTISDSTHKNGEVHSFNNEESLASRRRIANKIKPISGPMRPPINRSDSQVDFFKMLDEKIANGKDWEDGSSQDSISDANHSCERLVPPESSLITVSSIESETETGLQENGSGSLNRSPSPQCNSSFKINDSATSHKDIEKHSGADYHGVCHSPQRSFQESSSLSTLLSRSPSANSRQIRSANGTTRQMEEHCQSNANTSKFTSSVPRNLNNGEIPQDCTSQDSTSDIVTVTSPCHLSNGQVRS